jgi:pimeloyl-ACP methyl ester carboxylesterase
MHRFRLLFAVIFGLTSILLSGCAGMIGHMIVDAPNQTSHFLSSKSGRFIEGMVDPYFSVMANVPVGPPAATLSVAILPSANYRVGLKTPDKHAKKRCAEFHLAGPKVDIPGKWVQSPHKGQSRTTDHWSPEIHHLYAKAVMALHHTPPHATIILLHGYGENKYTMVPWAFALGEAGYRTVLVDFRGHGASTGQYTTYGILETRDIEQVIAFLDRHNLIAGPIAMLGDSLGAAVAIDAAARDKRIKAVVALHPFSRADEVIRKFGALAHPFWTSLLPESSLKAGERRAGELAGVDLARAAPIEAVENVAAPILFIYGSADKLTPPKTAHAFERAAPNGKLIMINGYNHVALSAAPEIAVKPVLEWLAPRLGGSVPRLVQSLSGKTGTHAGTGSQADNRFPLNFEMCFDHE